jgi:hypothetical protein
MKQIAHVGALKPANAESDITDIPFYVDYTLAAFAANGIYVPEESL